MRAGLVLVAPAVLLACARAPAGAATPVPPPSEPAAAVVVEAEPALAPEPQPAEAVSESSRLLAEVEAMEVSARWAWAVATLPELAEHREAGDGAASWAEFRRLVGARTRLWVRTRGDRCFAVRGGWEDDGFFGRAHDVTTVAGTRKTVRYEGVDITERGIISTGPHGEAFERDARGRWQPDGEFGLGSFATVAEGPAFEVKAGAAYFGAAAYTLKIVCSEASVREEQCVDGQPRRCSRCSRLTAYPQGPNMAMAGSMGSFVRGGDSVDCSAPCPPDVLGAQLAALELAVKGRTFIEAELPEAGVYTEARACRGDRRMR